MRVMVTGAARSDGTCRRSQQRGHDVTLIEQDQLTVDDPPRGDPRGEDHARRRV